MAIYGDGDILKAGSINQIHYSLTHTLGADNFISYDNFDNNSLNNVSGLTSGTWVFNNYGFTGRGINNTNTLTRGYYYSISGNEDKRDYEVCTRINMSPEPDGGHYYQAGVIGRFISGTNEMFYVGALVASGNAVPGITTGEILKISGATSTRLANISLANTEWTQGWLHISLVCLGSELQFLWQGRLIGSVFDTTYPSGTFGLYENRRGGEAVPSSLPFFDDFWVSGTG